MLLCCLSCPVRSLHCGGWFCQAKRWMPQAFTVVIREFTSNGEFTVDSPGTSHSPYGLQSDTPPQTSTSW
ncbi:hypothetical protein FJTKL_13643 [Diaporthe vaccinii]|uniref:Secreted protein n=1 Tax=Diaporthe vaccinii TaxID=105482 RepID=A0ABR4E9E3_9PEZI